MYIGPGPNLPANIQQAVRKLVQFQRTTLGPGQAADLTLHVTPRSLSSWSGAHVSSIKRDRTPLRPAAGENFQYDFKGAPPARRA